MRRITIPFILGDGYRGGPLQEAKRANTRFLVSRLFKDHVRHQLGWLIFALLLMVVVWRATASLAFLMETILMTSSRREIAQSVYRRYNGYGPIFIEGARYLWPNCNNEFSRPAHSC